MNKFVTALCAVVLAVGFASVAAHGQAGAGPTVQDRIQQLGDPNPQTRANAADALGNLGPRGSQAVPALTELLNSSVQTDRLSAAIALSKMGEAARPALPALVKLQQDKDPTIAHVAKLAAESIDPPVKTRVMAIVTSTWFLSTIIVLVSAFAAFFLMTRRRAAAADRKAAQPKAKPGDSKSPESAAAKQAKAAVQPAAPAAAPPPPDRSAQRKRVSRPLPGMESYTYADESPDKVKKELASAQYALNKIIEQQKDIADRMTKPEATGDQERLRSLKRESDELAVEHYKAQIRVKAYEIKMLLYFLSEGIGGDQSLRERSEATLNQRWEELTTYCSNPQKIWWSDGQWISSSTGFPVTIENLREHLLKYEVTLPEHRASAGGPPSTPAASTPVEGSPPEPAEN